MEDPYGSLSVAQPRTPGRPSSAGKWLVGCALLLVAVVAVAIGGGFLGWGAFSRFGMGTDLDDYQTKVQASDLDAATKTELGAEITRAQERIRSHELNPSFVRWVGHDESIRAALARQHVTPDELKEVREHLRAIAEDR